MGGHAAWTAPSASLHQLNLMLHSFGLKWLCDAESQHSNLQAMQDDMYASAHRDTVSALQVAMLFTDSSAGEVPHASVLEKALHGVAQNHPEKVRDHDFGVQACDIMICSAMLDHTRQSDKLRVHARCPCSGAWHKQVNF